MPAALQIIQSPEKAAVLLQPGRLDLLERLSQPDSAAGLARQLGVPRQKVNYHLRELEREGFVELIEERRKGNCMERVVRADGPRIPDRSAERRSQVDCGPILRRLSGVYCGAGDSRAGDASASAPAAPENASRR